MNLGINLSQYIGKPCIIKASGAQAIIKDFYRRRTGSGGIGVRFVVERDDDKRVSEYEPALLDIDLSDDGNQAN